MNKAWKGVKERAMRMAEAGVGLGVCRPVWLEWRECWGEEYGG